MVAMRAAWDAVMLLLCLAALLLLSWLLFTGLSA
jgi:hypothetical protein